MNALHHSRRLAGALKAVSELPGDGQRRRFLRSWARYPLEYAAARSIDALPRIGIEEVLDGAVHDVPLQPLLADVGDWSLNLLERLLLFLVVQGTGARRIFEIGTFNGGTTRLMAQWVPADGHVVTLDLPPERFDATQHPPDLHGAQIGSVFQGSSVESKITQLLEDSLEFDPVPYESSFDVVLVDGAHDYAHGLTDSRTALRLIRPGGVILWDDFEPHWADLVRGICTAMSGRRFGRFHGSSFAVHSAPG